MRLSAHNILSLLLFILVALVVVACGNQSSDYPADLPPGAYQPDPLFTRFYQKNGGYERFRHAISTPYSNQRGEKFQFFETVLMVYDPIEDRVYFDDLGTQLAVRDLPVQDWTGRYASDGLIVGQFYIPPAFASLYLELGPELVGQPLTQPYMNFSKNRMEQHFANLGMYYTVDDPDRSVGLLNYGEVACESCDHLDMMMREGIIDFPFSMPSVYRGMDDLQISISLAGKLLQDPVPVNDGSTDVVFDHLAVYEEGGRLKIRPVPVMLGMKDPFLYAPLNYPDYFVFFEYHDGVGHNVFIFFDEYIQQNGGYQISGKPITKIGYAGGGSKAFRQCFENYCLDYLQAADGPQVRPVSLGEDYLEIASKDYVTEPKSAPNEEDGEDFSSKPRNLNPFTLLLWETHTVIDSTMPQTISVMVELENTPQPGKELILTVTYPDGQEESVLMPASGPDGVTSFTLEPIAGENGDLVYYEACLYVQNMEPACVQQSFLIWGNP